MQSIRRIYMTKEVIELEELDQFTDNLIPEALTMDMVEQANVEYENIKEILVDIEINNEIKIVKVSMYKVFSPVAIRDCLTEYIRNMEKAKNISKLGFGDIAEPYLFYLFIKYFTTLGEEMPTKFNEQLHSMTHMINKGVLFQIVAHFEEEEIDLVVEELDNLTKTFEDNYGLIDEMKKLARDKVHNKKMFLE